MRRLCTRKEAARATTDAHRAARDQLVVHGLLQDLAEDSDHRVDRGVRECPTTALMGTTPTIRHPFQSTVFRAWRRRMDFARWRSSSDWPEERPYRAARCMCTRPVSRPADHNIVPATSVALSTCTVLG